MKQIYNQLKKEYGKQGWWPIINNKTLLCEYQTQAPKNKQEQFEIVIGCILAQNTGWYPNVVRAIQQLKLGRQLTKQEQEVLREAEINQNKISGNKKRITEEKILTQNTSWTNVEKAIYNLNQAKLLHPKSLIKIKKETIAKLIRPAGYFNQKAERLKFLAKYFLKNPKFLDKEIIILRQELLSLKGIGPETADSIILYAAEKPSFVIDAYTRRIFSRLGLIKKDLEYNKIKEFFENNIKKDTQTYKEYHALIVEHAKKYCKTKPICKGCILSKNCKFVSRKD